MGILERIRSSSPLSQVLVLAGLMMAVAAVCLAAYFLLLRRPYEVLFTRLRAMDAATVVAELDKKKVPYRLKDGGTTILVPAKVVDTTRLGVMSSDLPLKGMVGFELFNKSDMGLTEFAQRINYQRALQGELARTIMTMDAVDTARVHLSITEPTIFRGDRRPSKAAVTILSRPGMTLTPAGVRGIQQLVAGSVPELEAANVAVLGQNGEVVSGTAAPALAPPPESTEPRAIEQYYRSQVMRSLQAAYPETAIEVAVTAEDAGPAQAEAIGHAIDGEKPNGVVAGAADPDKSVLTAHDYRLRIAVSIGLPLDTKKEAEIREIVDNTLALNGGAAASVTVTRADASVSPEHRSVDEGNGPTPVAAGVASSAMSSPGSFWTWVLTPVLVLLLIIAALLHHRRIRPARLSAAQRDDYVRRLTAVLEDRSANAAS